MEGIRQWLKEPKHKRLAILLGAGMLVLLAGIGCYIWQGTRTGTAPQLSNFIQIPNLTTNATPEPPVTFEAVLDGRQVASEELAKRRPLAVMVENHPEARPQAGLVQASHVWEAIVEGGITRFMAVFSSQDAEKIGPIRSARPYFISWAAGYQALYAHAGGSQAGLALLAKTDDVVDLQHSARYFAREPQPGIASEHTLFSTSKDLYDYAAAKKASLTADVATTRFIDEIATADRPQGGSVTIDFSSATYKVEWTYDSESNSYKRNLAGEPHKDRVNDEQITAKNIAVLTVSRRYDSTTNQGKGEWFMTTEGSGKALLFQNGRAITATWKKPAQDSFLKLYDEKDQELGFVAGTTWFEVAPPDISVTHTEAEQVESVE